MEPINNVLIHENIGLQYINSSGTPCPLIECIADLDLHEQIIHCILLLVTFVLWSQSIVAGFEAFTEK